MRKTLLKKASVDELVNVYTEAALASGKALKDLDTKTQNRNADIIIKIYAELRARSLETQMSLLPLLSHEHPEVRCWAGAHALEFAPGQGEPVLEQLVLTEKNEAGFTAKTTLEEWRKGALRFP